jgi:DNA modification methylase
MILQGDCIEVMRMMEDNSVDAVITDPPYGLSKMPDMAEVLRHWLAGDDYVHKGAGFMGKAWDSFVPGPAVWRECFRVLKPGGNLIAFFGTRTYDMGVLAIRIAGFEIRDQIAWVYGSGFPKSLDVSKAIDKAAGAEREVVGYGRGVRGADGTGHENAMPGKATGIKQVSCDVAITAPATDAARQWAGWGTALKPAFEPIVWARKPFKGNVAENVLKHGTGAINIDGCRVGTETIKTQGGDKFPGVYGTYATCTESTHQGRFPSNFIHDGSDEVVRLFPDSKGWGGEAGDRSIKPTNVNMGGGQINHVYNDSGSAARFFYCAKASKRDRDEGCEGLGSKPAGGMNGRHNGSMGSITMGRNHHPTVKPTTLMRYLCRMFTPPNGIILDPFTGSGSTGKGATYEGFEFIGIDQDAEYVEIARARIAFAQKQVQEKKQQEQEKVEVTLFIALIPEELIQENPDQLQLEL